MSERRDCPFCKGKGTLTRKQLWKELGLAAPQDPDRLTESSCDACSGTGDYDTARLMRAVRLGEAQGMLRAIARINGDEIGPGRLQWDTVQAAVVDDMRLQRITEALDPESIEMRKLKDEVGQLRREREPFARAFVDFENELAARLEREVPA